MWGPSIVGFGSYHYRYASSREGDWMLTGGMFVVMFARPYAFRVHFAIWPTTFFLFILSAIACGPCFTILITWITEKFARKQLVKRNVFDILAKISGRLLALYLVLKTIDTLYWVAVANKIGAPFSSFYANQPYGYWVLVTELGVLGVIPAIILLSSKLRQYENVLILACILNCAGIFMNRWIMTVQSLAVPVMPPSFR